MEPESAQQKPRRLSGAALQRPELTQSLYRAFFDEWAERGYAALSLERVAKKAGAGKAAIYRRWSSKRDFASDAIQSVAFAVTPISDEGSLEADIYAFLHSLAVFFRHSKVRRILPDLLAERARSDELVPLLDTVATARRNRAEDLLDRAISRDELPVSLDRALALDLLPSPLYWRLIVNRKRASRSDLRRQAHVLAMALKAAG
ncbi:TetR/AcrR family transcriptional regulator C-terminal ligand-binding domain-containing protein [Tateyamaria omphalii]|uniref:TetR-like C-terminal domain-containing protein n=1 Tax=Tateyamaria omphalii TaxID=299262 RepID=UPI001C99D92C|nr:TetR-like C-terminal domain-containing protein [Tateyamaria omphalii]MBY5934558.1 TetR/AcrR family transcriptional regulator C-terminal ligand-binding domain-containing protein [Tateyamaria omphalii]